MIGAMIENGRRILRRESQHRDDSLNCANSARLAPCRRLRLVVKLFLSDTLYGVFFVGAVVIFNLASRLARAALDRFRLAVAARYLPPYHLLLPT
jgi:predicted HTH domain antitoxin